MKRREAIALFAYAFPHQKTQDFLVNLAAARFTDICVIAAPWRQLEYHDPHIYFPTSIRPNAPVDPRELCAALGFAFHELRHDDADAIRSLRDTHGFELGIIAGARILKRPVIELFAQGVLNIHPGKLPETSGLDLFYYTIAKNVPAGVTAHFIDEKIDAGEELFFEETPLGPDDGPEAVQLNNYHSQIRALRRFITESEAGALSRRKVDRPHKNEPMAPEEKRSTLLSFPAWRTAQYIAQQGRLLIAACETGDASAAAQILDRLPDLIEHRTKQGWTPLIVASFHQRVNVVRLLLARGADPNVCGSKGTTVLMYAKTALLGKQEPQFDVVEALLEAGSDPARRDHFGRSICDYLEEAGDTTIIRRIAEHEASR